MKLSLLTFLKVISSWGLGLRELIEAQAASQGMQADHERPEPMAGPLPVPNGGGTLQPAPHSAAGNRVL